MPPDSDPFQGLGVEVVSQGRTLKLYDDDDFDENDLHGDKCTRRLYVEAITGAKFAIQASINKHFKLYTLDQNDAVRVLVRYSCQSTGGSRLDFSRKFIEQELRAKQELTYNFDQAWEYCLTSHQWKRGSTVFSALTTQEASSSNYTPAQIKSLGLIRVEVQRLRRTKLQTRKAIPVPDDEPITAVTEKMIKGKAITNFVKIQDSSAAQPPDSEYDTRSIDGKAGELLCFEIRYRSRQNLQSLGFIPRTPSPEPTKPDISEENRVLRERIALLESNRTPNVKAESSASAGRGKREHQEAENERNRKRARHSTPVFVDLTED